MDVPGPSLSRVRAAATTVASALALGVALGGAWSPLLTRPPSSLSGADGVLDLGPADVVLQRSPDGCARAVLVMLLRDAGRATEGATALLEGPPVAADARFGLTLAEVADLARHAGLPGRWLRATHEGLTGLPLPFAAELGTDPPGAPGHLVLVRGVAPTGLLIADPERGLAAWPRDLFLRAWTGRVFVPERS